MVLRDGDPVGVPRVASLEDLGLEATSKYEVGDLDGSGCWAADLGPDAETPEGMMFRDLRGLWSVDGSFFAMARRTLVRSPCAQARLRFGIGLRG